MSKSIGIDLGTTNAAAGTMDGGQWRVAAAVGDGGGASPNVALGRDRERQTVRVPVRVQHKETLPQQAQDVERAAVDGPALQDRQKRSVEEESRGQGVQNRPPSTTTVDSQGDAEQWRDRALRLQAEMENFRKRQQRLTEQRVAEERERLLRQFVTIADDLERALEAGNSSLPSLREGVALTHQALMQLMAREGAQPIRPTGEMFNPEWHEAVSTVPHTAVGLRPNVVVDVVRDGYRIGDRLVRPARVIVAV